MNETPNIHILLVTDTKGTRKIALKELKYTIGRDINSNISINSKFVSRQHAILLRIPGNVPGTHLYRIIDGDATGKPSINGIIINSTNRVATYELSHGDIVTLAPDAQITYLIGETIGSEISKVTKTQISGGADDLDTLINEVGRGRR